MWMEISAIVAGLGLLMWGADRFVIGAAAMARNLGVSPLLIGLTIVGFGTSAPELMISTLAAVAGKTGLAIGNAVGSNIANIGLVLGATALIRPLDIASGTIRRELPVLMVISLSTWALFIDGSLGRADGLLLLAGLAALILWTVRLGMNMRRAPDPMSAEYAAEIPGNLSNPRALFSLVLGLGILLAGSRLLVWGASAIATDLGVSDLVIGLTIVAVGTSLPELATSIASAIKRESDIAVGNIIGSNMFNLLGVLGLPGLIRPGPVDAGVLSRDLPVMIGMTVLLALSAHGLLRPGRINRIEAGIMLASYGAYQTLLYFSART